MYLWRAAEKDGYFDAQTWWAEDYENAEAYLDNPGFGGPCLYRGTFSGDGSRVLDLTEESGVVSLFDCFPKERRQEMKDATLGRMAESGDYDPDFDCPPRRDDVILAWWRYELERGIYEHDLVEDLYEPGLFDAKYDWIRILDSFPHGAVTRMRVTDLSPKEEASIRLVNEC